MREQAGRDHQHQRQPRARRRHADVAGGAAEGHHDEGHLQALQEDALEGDGEAWPVHRRGCRLAGLPQRRHLRRVDRLLVVQRLEAGGAQDRLAQPLQAEDEQQRADHQAQRREGNERGHRRPEDRDQRRQGQHRRADPQQGAPPAAGHAGGEDDGQRLDHLHRRGEERREDQERPAHSAPFGRFSPEWVPEPLSS